MRILAIGDLHGKLESLKKIDYSNVDLILLTGDIGKSDIVRNMFFENVERAKKGLKKKEFPRKMRKKGYMEVYNSSIKVIKYLAKLAPVFLVCGNVEYTNKEVEELSKEIKIKLPCLLKHISSIKNVRTINNKSLNFSGVKIVGVKFFLDECWVKNFKPKNYVEKMEDARKESKKIRKFLEKTKKADILLCHQPPYGVLDKVGAEYAPKNWIGKHAGSKVILSYIKENKPKYVLCGHIHEAQGFKKLGKTIVYNLGVAGHKIIDIN